MSVLVAILLSTAILSVPRLVTLWLSIATLVTMSL